MRRFVMIFTLRAVQLSLLGLCLFGMVERFYSEGWRTGLTYFLLAIFSGALFFAVFRWLDRLPDPERQDCSDN